MDFNITTQGIDHLTIERIADADHLGLNDGASYAVTIAPNAEGGYTVTDETGGDAEADTMVAALRIAADFIENVADEDHDWLMAAAQLRIIAG